MHWLWHWKMNKCNICNNLFLAISTEFARSSTTRKQLLAICEPAKLNFCCSDKRWQRLEIFYPRILFSQNYNPSRPLVDMLHYFQIWFRFREGIRFENFENAEDIITKKYCTVLAAMWIMWIRILKFNVI